MEPLEGRSLLSVVTTPIADQPPALAPLATQSVEEGSSLALHVTATDPNPGHTVTCSLDLGAPAGAAINPASGLLTWTPPNVQATYSMTIRATDSGPAALFDAETLTVIVFDVPPAVSVGIDATVTPGTEFVRSGSFTDPNSDSWTATVDYGDGSGVQPLALGPDKTFELGHTYTTAGNYVVSVTIIDSQGGQGHGYFAVQVQPPSTSTASNNNSTTNPTPTPTGTSQEQPAATAYTVTAQSAPGNSSPGTTTTSPLLKAVLTFKAKHPHLRIPVRVPPGHKHH
jgi:hypothetical protein